MKSVSATESNKNKMSVFSDCNHRTKKDAKPSMNFDKIKKEQQSKVDFLFVPKQKMLEKRFFSH